MKFGRRVWRTGSEPEAELKPGSGSVPRRRLRPRLGNPVAYWRRMSLRARLALLATIAVAAGIGGGVVFSYVAVRHELISQIDETLGDQAHQRVDRIERSELALSLVPPSKRGPSRTAWGTDLLKAGDTQDFVQAIDVHGTVLTALLDRPIYQKAALPVAPQDVAVATGDADSALRTVNVAGAQFRMLTVPLRGHRAIQVAVPLDKVDSQLSVVGWQLLAAGGAGIVLAALGGWVVTRTALRPVAELTGTAERIAATHDLAHRIPVPAQTDSRDEIARLATSFNSMLDAVQESTDRQRQLVADASHELRTPLTALRTNVEVLAKADRLDPDDRKAVVASVMSGIDDLTALVADTVELARGEERAGEFEEVRWDLLVERCVERARDHWPAVRFDVVSEDCVVVGVSDRLAKAVRNLLDNAAKFSTSAGAAGTADDVGTVEVRIVAEDGQAVLTVRDHGPGVPEADLAHVFDRFYRSVSARDMPGSGLGLAIVAQVAGGHRGEVVAANADGGGAVFRLSIPVVSGSG